MKKLLIICFGLIFLVSCEVSQSNNIYLPPKNKTKPVENFFYFNDLYSLEVIKNNIRNILIINENNIKEIESSDINSFIDCGYMNDEKYVDYINRIFDSSLLIEIVFRNQKMDDKDIVFIYFNYTFKSKETGTTWRFTSNKSKDLLVGNPVYDDNPYRECSSTQNIESSLKNVLKYSI